MPIPYNPNDARKTLPPGDYTAELIASIEKTSKSGKPMLELTWRIYPDNDHPTVQLRDWVVVPDGVWKLKKLAQAWGKEAEFKSATFDPCNHIGSNVMVALKVRQDDKYGEQNSISNYKPMKSESSSVFSEALKRATQEKPVEPTFAPDQPDQEIPF